MDLTHGGNYVGHDGDHDESDCSSRAWVKTLAHNALHGQSTGCLLEVVWHATRPERDQVLGPMSSRQRQWNAACTGHIVHVARRAHRLRHRLSYIVAGDVYNGQQRFCILYPNGVQGGSMPVTDLNSWDIRP